LVPGIHALERQNRKTWIAGTSPAMTVELLRDAQRALRNLSSPAPLYARTEA